jgi:hypothetical protein
MIAAPLLLRWQHNILKYIVVVMALRSNLKFEMQFGVHGFRFLVLSDHLLTATRTRDTAQLPCPALPLKAHPSAIASRNQLPYCI